MIGPMAVISRDKQIALPKSLADMAPLDPLV